MKMEVPEMFEDFPALPNLAFYATLCLVKMLFVALLTSKNRVQKEIYANEEDLKLGTSKAKITFTDGDIERIRRIHQNDLENILPFILVGFFYVMTQPSLGIALWHFRIFTASRLLHTIVYRFSLPQPSRALSFFVGVLVILSMAVQVLFSMPF